MKLLITGATGLVGTALVEQALLEGFSIHYLTTNESKLTQIKGAYGFYWNPASKEIELDCFKGVDCIIHLAGASISKRWTKSYKAKILSSRVDSTRLLFSSLEKLKDKLQVKQIITASAIGVYPSELHELQTEATTVAPNSFMEQVVLAWEKEANSFSSLGISLATLRIGLVLASNGGLLEPLKIPTSLGLGAAFGNGKQGQSWIHVEDVVGIILKACKEGWKGVFNAVSPNPVSQNALIGGLAKALKRPYFLPPLPKFVIQLMVGEMSSLVLDSHWVSSEKVLQTSYKFKHPHLKEALENVLKLSKR